MRRYEFLDQPTLHCVHFVRASPPSGFLEEHVEAARKAGVIFAYWNYLHGGREAITLADPIGVVLRLEHPPYGLPWVQFLDDLITNFAIAKSLRPQRPSCEANFPQHCHSLNPRTSFASSSVLIVTISKSPEFRFLLSIVSCATSSLAAEGSEYWLTSRKNEA